MTPHELLRRHAPNLIARIREAGLREAAGPAMLADLSAVLDDEEALCEAFPDADPVPGEAAFWRCVESLLRLCDLPHPERSTAALELLDGVRRNAERAAAGEPLPAGLALDARPGVRAARLAAVGTCLAGGAAAAQSRFAIELRTPLRETWIAGKALRAVLRRELPWRRQRRGERVPPRDLFPLEADHERDRALDLAGRLFSTIAFRAGPGLAAACGGEAPLAALAPGARVRWQGPGLPPGTVQVDSRLEASVDACAEAASALVREGGLDPVAFEWIEFRREGGEADAGSFRRGWVLCAAEGPRPLAARPEDLHARGAGLPSLGAAAAGGAGAPSP